MSRRQTKGAKPELERLLTTAKVGRVLGKTAQAMRMMIYRGQLPAVKVGARALRVKESDLQTFLRRLRRA
jgi:excisionase family DNA binding protein